MPDHKVSRNHSLCELIEFECPPHRSLEVVLDPPVPALPQTVLCLDLLLQESSVDLQTVSQLILGDLGATVQILRLAGWEFENSDDRPDRIEDCIASLGLRTCFEAVSMCTAPHDIRRRRITECWRHAREIAEYSMLVAADLPDLRPGDAYLAGLLHEIGSLPSILGWRTAGSDPVDEATAGAGLAMSWSLPGFVVDSLNDLSPRGRTAPWTSILRCAHALAGATGRNERFAAF